MTPLVPYVDYMLFASSTLSRVALNIGGIANITVIPAGPIPGDILAFDTGPGNMAIDALVAHHTEGKQRYDRNGSIASRGKVHERLLEAMLSDPYLERKPPKSAGREQFGQPFVTGLLATGIALPDLIATATEFTARSIAFSIVRTADPTEVIVSGGGLRNRWLMQRLRALLNSCEVKSSDDFGVDPDAKEAIAFAVLAYEFVRGRPGNLPSATGARRSAILGKSSPA